LPFAASLQVSTINFNLPIKSFVMGKLTAGEKKRRRRGKAAESKLQKIKKDSKVHKLAFYETQRDEYRQQRKDTKKKGIRAVLKKRIARLEDLILTIENGQDPNENTVQHVGNEKSPKNDRDEDQNIDQPYDLKGTHDMRGDAERCQSKNDHQLHGEHHSPKEPQLHDEHQFHKEQVEDATGEGDPRLMRKLEKKEKREMEKERKAMAKAGGLYTEDLSPGAQDAMKRLHAGATFLRSTQE
ncbi:hypothetical protein YB2330_006527, partial [Saitoella coloradoensis]